MTKTFDPYATLNIAKTADIKKVRAAAKAHAKKNHPDAGGHRDEFERGRRALAVLIDPKAREKFDKTGETDEAAVDNTLSSAMQIIESEILKLTDGYLASGFDPQRDPSRLDVVRLISNELKKTIATTKKVRKDGERYLDFLHKFGQRFSKKSAGVVDFDFIQRRFEDQMRHVENQLAEVEKSLAIHGLALKIIQSYDFKVDTSPFVGMTTAGTSTAGMFTIRIG